MSPAVSNYARYRVSPLAWMLGRFICPVSRLQEFGSAAGDRLDSANPWELSVLATGGDRATEFLAALTGDIETLDAFHGRSGTTARTDAIEVRFPAALHEAGTREELAGFLQSATTLLGTAEHSPASVFFELDFVADWPERHRQVASAVADHNPGSPVTFGLKVRTGGVTPEAIPHPDAVAGFLLEARDAGVPFKATAGLHHPLRHPDPGLGSLHGFLNVFVGAALLWHRRIESESLRDLIRDEDPTAFGFQDASLNWRGLDLGAGPLREARKSFAISFGSCSFEEPWEDLHRMGLLPTPPPGQTPSQGTR